MKAIGFNILIKKEKEGIKATKGGLLLSESQRSDIRYVKATIQSVGDLCNGLNPKDVIYYDRHAGHLIDVEGDSFQVIKMQDVVFVL
jgi:co-chaperonin GroES (HSP10)|tara:strand:- start:1611 stop:1871 length:261 start_codon:yes stop_codon:yes gene_type:complete